MVQLLISYGIFKKKIEKNKGSSSHFKMYFEFNTSFGAKDDMIMILSEEAKSTDQMMLDMYDFELLESPPSFLPGVNAETKKDGSVRYYGA